MRGRQTDTGTGRQGEDRQGESVRERATGRGQTGRVSQREGRQGERADRD